MTNMAQADFVSWVLVSTRLGEDSIAKAVHHFSSNQGQKDG